jgi:hypothetical protein
VGQLAGELCGDAAVDFAGILIEGRNFLSQTSRSNLTLSFHGLK